MYLVKFRSRYGSKQFSCRKVEASDANHAAAIVKGMMGDIHIISITEV
jgi:hypothetical protein